MLEKIKRKKVIGRQDITKPKTVDDLIQKYDLDNTKIIEYLDYMVDSLNKVEVGNLQYNTNYVIGTPDVFSYCKIGNIVQISFRGKIANDIPNGTIIFNLPYNSAIAYEIYGKIGEQYTYDKMHFMYCSKGKNNVVISRFTNGNNSYLHVAFTYICEEN